MLYLYRGTGLVEPNRVHADSYFLPWKLPQAGGWRCSGTHTLSVAADMAVAMTRTNVAVAGAATAVEAAATAGRSVAAVAEVAAEALTSAVAS